MAQAQINQASQASPAAETPQPNTGIADIVVTAERRESSIQKTPIAVAALNAAALKSNGVNDIRDIQSLVPSVSISANTGLEFPIAIRGISSSIGGIGADSPTAVYLDGVYIARPLATIFDLADTQRVEVLRGPQGTLYGRNSTGGAISIITRDPTRTLTADASIDVGSYNLVTVKGAIRGPLIGNQVLMSLYGSYRHRDGFYTDVTTGQTGLNPDNSYQVGGAIAIDPDGPFHLTLRADYARAQLPAASKELLGVFGSPLWTPQNANLITTNDPGQSFARSGGASATASYDLDWATIKSITAFRFERVETTNDVDASAINFQRIALGPEREQQYSQEFQIASKDWRYGSYVFGLYAFGENSTNKIIFEQFDAVPVTATQFLDLYINNSSKIRDRNYATYGQVDLKLTSALTATLGGRYTWERKNFGFGTASQVAPATTPEPAQIPVDPAASPDQINNVGTYKAFTPKFGLSWRVTPDIFLYGSVQKGFKSGGYSFSDGSAPGFGPEKIWSYEAGVKTNWLANRLHLNLTGFWYDYRDLQVSLAGGPGERFTANAATSTIKGLELELTAEPVPHLTISGFGSLLDARYKSYEQDLSLQNTGGVPFSISCPGGRLQDNNTICNLSGNYLPRAPKWSYTLAARYEWRVSGITVTPQLTWHHEAETFYNEQNVWPLVGRGVQDLSARIGFGLSDRLKLSIYGNNLTDYRYIAGALPVTPTVAGFSNWPRTFGAQIAFSF